MLKSMTGFGRCEQVTDQYKISVEIKAVNHDIWIWESGCQRSSAVLRMRCARF